VRTPATPMDTILWRYFGTSVFFPFLLAYTFAIFQG